MHQLGNIEVLRNDKSPAELAQVLFDDNGGFLINNKKFLYHRSVETLASAYNVITDFTLLAADLKNQCCVIKGVAEYKNKKFNATGEVHPSNNSFPFFIAVAEKRAIDRAVLKALGLHGYYYSESEKDDRAASFNMSATPVNPTSMSPEQSTASLILDKIKLVSHIGNFRALITEHKEFFNKLGTTNPELFKQMSQIILDKKNQLQQGEANNG